MVMITESYWENKKAPAKMQVPALSNTLLLYISLEAFL